MSLTVRTQTTQHFELTISSDQLREVINNFLVQKFFEARKIAGVPHEGSDFSKKVKVEIEKRTKLLTDEGLAAFETFEDGPFVDSSSSFCLTFAVDGTHGG